MLLLVSVNSKDRALVDVGEVSSTADVEKPKVLTTNKVLGALKVIPKRVAADMDWASETLVLEWVVFVVLEALLKRPVEEVSVDDRVRVLAMSLESAVVV